MKFTTALSFALTLAPFVAQANPVANNVVEREPDALERRDNICRVDTKDGNVNCREGAGTGYDIVTQFGPNDRFLVSCKANGEDVFGDRVWDYVPGWGCWVASYYSRPTGSSAACETGVRWC